MILSEKGPDTSAKKIEKSVTYPALIRFIVLSAISVLICLTCLFRVSWAWLSVSGKTGTDTITGAGFDLCVTVTEEGSGIPAEEGADGCFALDPAKTYTVRLTATGTATTGFCHLTAHPDASGPATAYDTAAISKPGDAADPSGVFSFTVSGFAKIRFTPTWGQSPEDRQERLIRNHGTLCPEI